MIDKIEIGDMISAGRTFESRNKYIGIILEQHKDGRQYKIYWIYQQTINHHSNDYVLEMKQNYNNGAK